MVLSLKFNDYFKTGQASDLMLGLYMADTYGSNSFDFAKAARIAPPVNDHAEAAQDPARKPLPDILKSR